MFRKVVDMIEQREGYYAYMLRRYREELAKEEANAKQLHTHRDLSRGHVNERIPASEEKDNKNNA